MSTPQFIPRREREAQRRKLADGAIVPHEAPGTCPDGHARPATGLAADLVTLSALLAGRVPIDPR